MDQTDLVNSFGRKTATNMNASSFRRPDIKQELSKVDFTNYAPIGRIRGGAKAMAAAYDQKAIQAAWREVEAESAQYKKSLSAMARKTAIEMQTKANEKLLDAKRAIQHKQSEDVNNHMLARLFLKSRQINK